jgi:hypothetical protein
MFKMVAFVICLPSHIGLCDECCKKNIARQLVVSMTTFTREEQWTPRREEEIIGWAFVFSRNDVLFSLISPPTVLIWSHLKSGLEFVIR